MHLHATSWSNDIIREMNCCFIVNFTVIFFRLLYNIYVQSRKTTSTKLHWFAY